MWIIISVVLAINSIWLLKLNKDLANRNEYLIRQVEANRHNSGLIFEPMSDEQIEELKKVWKDRGQEEIIRIMDEMDKEEERLKKHSDDNKED